ncbi:hypothetical protein F5148DRAFT_20640 [Russula earlei]|uniref:Uncharacterized protein n=1 Tax=Russula earlei TaxID=71964 RepID=A0ACC0U8U1_9AGAM|nr:hypothetical protein F5148DRAFT_20640 [Russula earlei]
MVEPTDYEEIGWLHTQLTVHVNGLSDIYEHISSAIYRLQDEKTRLQNRVEQLEQDDPSAEVRRLHEENSILRALLATAAKEKSEITWERDTLFRKLNTIKQLIDGSTLDERVVIVSADSQNTEPSPPSITSTVRPQSEYLARARVQHVVPVAEHVSPAPTDLSEPKTDVTTVNDTFGRLIRSPLKGAPAATAAFADGTSHPSSSQPLSPQPSTTVAPLEQHALLQDGEANTLSPDAALAPFANPPGSASSTMLVTPPVRGPLSADFSASPSPARYPTLNTSLGLSEGLSVQYDEAQRPGTSPANIGTAMVQKWRIHFAKPPTSAMVVGLAKPVPTATLIQNLELDEDSRRSIEGLSSGPPRSLRLYISDVFGLAFLYDPVFLESPEATYVVEWCDLKSVQTSKAYITTAKDKHAELHTFIYAPRKNGWHYLGQQRWTLVETKSIWNSLGSPAQNALAARSSQSGDPTEITRDLRKGQLEQLTIKLQQVSVIHPNAGESVLLKKLSDEVAQ